MKLGRISLRHCLLLASAISISSLLVTEDVGPLLTVSPEIQLLL